MEQRDSLLPLLQVAHVKCRDRRQLLRAASLLPPLRGGVCCSILMTKREAGARSHYHILICLKRAPLTIQSAGVRRNPAKAGGGCVNDKRQKQPHFFFLHKTRVTEFQSTVRLLPKTQDRLHAFQWWSVPTQRKRHNCAEQSPFCC